MPQRQFALWFSIALLIFSLGAAANAAFVEVRSGAADTDDAPLYSDPGNTATRDQNSGANSQMYVGETGTAGPRRSVVRFDVSTIPTGSSVSDVSLQMTITGVPGLFTPVNSTHNLHRITSTTIWTEGTGVGTGAGGTAANAGEITWNSVSHPTGWTSAGGDFDPTPSAGVAVGTTTGTITWTDNTPGDGLVADVQAWIDGSQPNNGWIVVGGEGVPGTARVFATSESGAPAARPTLTITLATLPVELSVFTAN